MSKVQEQPICQFYRLIPDAPEPLRAARAADGKIPLDAYQYCEPFRAASAFGWHVYPPLNFCLLRVEDELMWKYEGADHDDWMPLQGGAQYPGLWEHFDQLAPPELEGFAPPLILQGSAPGQAQIWSGWLARTAPGWALLSRAVANATNIQPYRNYDGLVETDCWFGPLFTNLRLTRTNSPVYFRRDTPFFQVQPVPKECYQKPSFEVHDGSELNAQDWQDFKMVAKRAAHHMRPPGQYAVAARKRLRTEEAAE